MRPELIEHLRDPFDESSLALADAEFGIDGEVRSGRLCGHDRAYDIVDYIPRFVGAENYSSSFGDQWNWYRRIQLDRYNGTTLSRDRFFRDTGWDVDSLRGQKILEAGCGAGRFTQVMLDAGAEVYAIDFSAAVNACWSNNGPHPSLFLAQADIFALPFQRNFFDKVFCFGVLQHTPDVKRAFMSLLPFLKSGGDLAVDVYRKTAWTTRWTSKFWYRPLTKRMPRDLLRKIIEWYVPRWIPIDNFLQRVPVARSVVPAIVPCWNYTGSLPLPPDQITIMAVLDTFDALTPAYDQPQTIASVQSWFDEAALQSVNVRFGGNGIIGTARKLS
jgi:SAM-dependent methyltransferase